MVSPDQEGGYPGELQVEVQYRFDDENRLTLSYSAQCNQDTICNLTNHSYFHLQGSGDILNHELQIFADSITPVGEDLIPTGALLEVTDTPFDFREPKALGKEIDADHEQIAFGGGYDHNFVFCKGHIAAKAICRESGRTLTVFTDLPGMQLYSGNFLNGERGENGQNYRKRAGFCLEMQLFPDAVAHSEFPSPILKAGAWRKHETVFLFGTVDN